MVQLSKYNSRGMFALHFPEGLDPTAPPLSHHPTTNVPHLRSLEWVSSGKKAEELKLEPILGASQLGLETGGGFQGEVPPLSLCPVSLDKPLLLFLYSCHSPASQTLSTPIMVWIIN